MKSRAFSRLAVAASLLVAGVSVSELASAETAFQATHPRRAEVNARLANQNRRITNEVRSGEISHAQAHQLRSEDRTVRAEERTMAAGQGGHLTAGQTRALNRQENGISRQIGR